MQWVQVSKESKYKPGTCFRVKVKHGYLYFNGAIDDRGVYDPDGAIDIDEGDEVDFLDESPYTEKERIKQLEDAVRTAHNLMITSGPLTTKEIFDQVEIILQKALK